MKKMEIGTKPPTREKNDISGGVDGDFYSVKTDKQRMFIAAWDGNIKTTAEKVGLSYDYCRQLVTKPHIKEALQDGPDRAAGHIAHCGGYFGKKGYLTATGNSGSRSGGRNLIRKQ